MPSQQWYQRRCKYLLSSSHCSELISSFTSSKINDSNIVENERQPPSVSVYKKVQYRYVRYAYGYMRYEYIGHGYMIHKGRYNTYQACSGDGQGLPRITDPNANPTP